MDMFGVTLYTILTVSFIILILYLTKKLEDLGDLKEYQRRIEKWVIKLEEGQEYYKEVVDARRLLNNHFFGRLHYSYAPIEGDEVEGDAVEVFVYTRDYPDTPFRIKEFNTGDKEYNIFLAQDLIEKLSKNYDNPGICKYPL